MGVALGTVAEGRWLDDAYGGTEPVHSAPSPRLDKWLKWSWPAALVAAGAGTIWWGAAGWLLGAAFYIGGAYPFHRIDRHRSGTGA